MMTPASATKSWAAPHTHDLSRRLLRACWLGLVLSYAAVVVDIAMADGTAQQSSSHSSPGALLAPYSVTRNESLVTKLSSNSWYVAAGQPVVDFFGANGQDEIIRYNWNKVRGAWHDPALVSLAPVVQKGKGKMNEAHDLADLLKLTEHGAQRGGSKQGGARLISRYYVPTRPV